MWFLQQHAGREPLSADAPQQAHTPMAAVLAGAVPAVKGGGTLRVRGGQASQRSLVFEGVRAGGEGVGAGVKCDGGKTSGGERRVVCGGGWWGGLRQCLETAPDFLSRTHTNSSHAGVYRKTECSQGSHVEHGGGGGGRGTGLTTHGGLVLDEARFFNLSEIDVVEDLYSKAGATVAAWPGIPSATAFHP
jgi:hypothetical protein